MPNQEWVYPFSELERVETRLGGDWDAVRGMLGGKGANLADMTRLGVPVPPGFTVTTEACNAFLAAGEALPDGLWEQTLAALESVEKQTDREFGSPRNPLLLSITHNKSTSERNELVFGLSQLTAA